MPHTHTYTYTLVPLDFPSSPAATDERGQHKASSASSVLKLPSYMNPGAMNPVKFHDIQEKRKLLWGGKKKEVLGGGTGQGFALITHNVLSLHCACTGVHYIDLISFRLPRANGRFLLHRLKNKRSRPSSRD